MHLTMNNVKIKNIYDSGWNIYCVFIAFYIYFSFKIFNNIPMHTIYFFME